MKNIHLLATENYKQDYTLQSGEDVKVVRLGQLIINKEYNELSVNKNPQWSASCDTDVLVPHHIYITSDEEIKEGDAYITKHSEICKSHNGSKIILFKTDKKIILTTDQDLIAEGVQSIDDEFLEWFVQNPTCEKVEVNKIELNTDYRSDWKQKFDYIIIIPQEEPKHSKVFSENGNQLLFDKQGNLIKEEHNPFELPEVLPDVIFYESLQETKQETLEEVVRKYPLINQRIGFKNGAKTFEENMIEIMDSYADDVMGGSTLRGKEWFEQFKKK